MLTESFEGKIYSRIEILPHEDRARIAETAAREAARELEIVPTPKVRFFCPAYLGETVWGHIANDGEIHVNANQSDADVIRTVIHEIRHLWQQHHPNGVIVARRLKRTTRDCSNSLGRARQSTEIILGN